MAEQVRKIPITLDGAETEDDGFDSSFEAANAIPSVADDLEDDQWERRAIDLDAPVADALKVDALKVDALKVDALKVDALKVEAIEQAPAVSSIELDGLRAQAKTANDSYLRALADLQNFRRRGEEEKLRIIRDANERLIKDLLPVLDDFDLALDAARKTESYEQLIGGVSAVARKFLETLGKQGVAAIPAVGEAFDAEVHEAVMLDEDSDEPEETVTSELRKGYTLHGRVIRPSLVKVAKKS